MFDLFLQSPAAPDLMYHWSDMGKPTIVKGRVYRPAPIVEVDMPLSKSVFECARDVSGHVVVWSSDLCRLWHNGKYVYAELVLSLASLEKDNRVSILPLHHYEWKGQPKTFQYPKTVLSFGRNTADGERCRRTGAYRPRLNMRMGHLW